MVVISRRRIILFLQRATAWMFCLGMKVTFVSSDECYIHHIVERYKVLCISLRENHL